MNRLLIALVMCQVLSHWSLICCRSTFAEQSSVEGSDQPNSANSEVPSTGETNSDVAQLDALIRKILLEHDIPGAAIAVARNNCLLYSRGFGYADKKNHSVVQPTSLFRIASLSKPITATAILKLCETGVLNLDDKVLSILDEYGIAQKDSEKFDARWHDVTVRHVLQHRAGWDRDKAGDPMFSSLDIAEAMSSQSPASHRDIILHMLTKPLDFNPGERYCYSNFGYCLLGRVIERISGQGYEEFVKKEVLLPIGITDMRIGSSLPKFRAEGEVFYYDRGRGISVFDVGRPEVPQPYGAWSLEAMDAHGGWIASAVELVKFGAGYFGTRRSSHIQEESFQSTIAQPLGPIDHGSEDSSILTYYGLGWQVFVNDSGKLVQLSHRGSLPGTSSLLVCRADGICYAILFNGRESPLTDNVIKYIENDLWEVIGRVESWPTASNLFDD